MNPVLERELRVRVRSWRYVFVLLGFLLLVGLVAWIAYESQRSANSGSFAVITATENARIGHAIFSWNLLLILILVHFTIPGLVSGAIAGERQSQTLVPLQVTLMKPLSIVTGKIGAAVAFVLLLVVATIPVLAIGYLIGGVSVNEILRSIVGVTAVTILYASVALLCSALSRTVQVAAVLSYGAVLLMSLGSFGLYGIGAVIDARTCCDPIEPPDALLYGSPVVAFADFLDTGRDFGNSPIAGLASVTDDGGRPFWVDSTVVLGLVCAGSVALSTRRLKTPGDSEQ